MSKIDDFINKLSNATEEDVRNLEAKYPGVKVDMEYELIVSRLFGQLMSNVKECFCILHGRGNSPQRANQIIATIIESGFAKLEAEPDLAVPQKNLN